MKHNRDRPKAKSKKDKYLEVRVTSDEKAGFSEAASLAGLSLSSWVRERVRLAAIRELEAAGRQIPFVEPVSLRREDD